jgi:hypothetical protein
MTLFEAIQQTGHVPNSMTTADGSKFMLFTRRLDKNRGYRVDMWRMVKGVQHDLIIHGIGDTVESAKEDIKDKILKMVEA